LRRLAEVRLHHGFADDGHDVRRAMAKVDPGLGVSGRGIGLRHRAQVRVGGDESASQRGAQGRIVDLRAAAAVSCSQELSVPCLQWHPYLDVDMGSRRWARLNKHTAERRQIGDRVAGGRLQLSARHFVRVDGRHSGNRELV
jgi:hypothetical protein